MRAKPPPILVSVPTGEPVLEDQDDDALMQLACAGLSAALETLIRRHQGALRAYCARRCGSAGDDIAQEVFVTMWARRASYRPGGRFRAYLFTLADHRCSNDTRGQRRSQRKHAAQDPPAAPDDPLHALLTSERQRRLHETLGALPADQQRAILLHYSADLPYDEIAQIVQKPAATVRSRVFLGLCRLRQLLQARGEP